MRFYFTKDIIFLQKNKNDQSGADVEQRKEKDTFGKNKKLKSKDKITVVKNRKRKDKERREEDLQVTDLNKTKMLKREFGYKDKNKVEKEVRQNRKRKEKSSIDSGSIKIASRRNAGLCTIGITKKKKSFAPMLECTTFCQPQYVSYQLPFCCPPISFLQVPCCQDDSALQCC